MCQNHCSIVLWGRVHTVICLKYVPHCGMSQRDTALAQIHWDRNIQEGRHHSSKGTGSLHNLKSSWRAGLSLEQVTWISLCNSTHHNRDQKDSLNLLFHKIVLLGNLSSYQYATDLVCRYRCLELKTKQFNNPVMEITKEVRYNQSHGFYVKFEMTICH